MRLIDADSLKETILEKSDGLADLWDTAGVCNAINKAPTVEAIPLEFHEKVTEKTTGELLECQSNLRPKGKWIRKTVNFPPCYDEILVNECSECKEDFVYYNSDTNFCPNCGADMREGEK